LLPCLYWKNIETFDKFETTYLFSDNKSERLFNFIYKIIQLALYFTMNSKIAGNSIKKNKSTRNPFLNYVKEFRARGGFKNAATVTKEAAKQWKQMSEHEKKKYRDEANKVPKNAQKPVFNRLNEQQLGATHRQYLYLFKAAINDYVENCVEQVKNGQKILENSHP
jgi:hypothetical protein